MLSAKKIDFHSLNQADETKKFNEGVILSLIVHLLIIAAFVLQVTFFSKPIIDLSQAVRVDMVALPQKLESKEMPQKIQEILKEAPTPTVLSTTLPMKEIKTEPEAINLKKNKAKQKAALEKLTKMSAIEKLREEAKEEKKQLNKNEETVRKQEATTKPIVKPIKGRVISAGTALAGLDKLQADDYLQNLDAHIKQFWALPQWLMNKSYRTQILVKFDSSGKVLFKQIVRPSGQPAYDDYCLAAIDQADPFPKFIEKFVEKYRQDGVIIGFPE